jgi:hypothetical protein
MPGILPIIFVHTRQRADSLAGGGVVVFFLWSYTPLP